jgi:hypothetical protein
MTILGLLPALWVLKHNSLEESILSNRILNTTFQILCFYKYNPRQLQGIHKLLKAHTKCKMHLKACHTRLWCNAQNSSTMLRGYAHA